MGDRYGGGIVVDVNYAKDEVIIAFAEDGVGILVGNDILISVQQDINTFNNNEERGHSDWMLPNLFDAKRIDPALISESEYWTSTEFDNDEQITVIFNDGNVVKTKSYKTTSNDYVVVRKQVVTA